MNTIPTSLSDYWNNVASQKTFSHSIVYEQFNKYVPSHSSPILDYGCGYGRIIRDLHANGYVNLCGIDFACNMIERAKKENLFAHYFLNDGNTTPFTANSFDAICLLAVLTCIPSSNNQTVLFSELYDLLVPGGIVYVSDLLLNDDSYNKVRYDKYVTMYSTYGIFELEEGGVFRHHTKEYLYEVVNKFSIIWQEEFIVKTMNGNTSNAIRMILRK